MDCKMEAERSELLPRGPSALSAARGKSTDMLSMSNSIVPGPTRSLLQSRIDHQEMLEWQEGGGETLQDAHQGEAIPEPTLRKFDHPTICGIDKRPFFPTVLFVSLVWSLCMTKLQSMVFTRLFASAHCTVIFLAMYIITIGAAMHTSLSNPGLLSEEQFRRLQAGEIALPARAHKHWLYRRPVLRFHQYCRWVTNCIGLRNHRSYMVMLCGFVTIAVSDAVVDLVLIPANFTMDGASWTTALLLLVHLVYSVYFAWYSAPLLRQHAAFIYRNELTQDWKRDTFYIIRDEETGEAIPVNNLDTETYNRYFDANAFEYDASKNPLDKGWVNNCLAFWLTSRSEEELGEF